MWLWLLILLGFYFLYRWYRDHQVLQNLTDKYVFITGCDSGFGNQLARQLDGRGLQVLASCLTQRGAEQLKEATSQKLQTIILDVGDSQQVTAAANWVKQQVGDQGLWGLVNNAGIGIPGAPNEWLTKDDFVKVLDVNLLGMIDVTLCLLPLIRKAKGRIINVSSIVGRITFCGGGYCISKYGIEAFSDSLRREMNPFGVKVIILEPGFFKTELNNLQRMRATLHNIWRQVPAAVQEIYGQQYFEDYVKHTEKTFLMLCNPDLSPVSDHMEHALTAVHPNTRYSAGWDAKLFYIPLSYLPTALADFLLTGLYPNQQDPDKPMTNDSIW